MATSRILLLSVAAVMVVGALSLDAHQKMRGASKQFSLPVVETGEKVAKEDPNTESGREVPLIGGVAAIIVEKREENQKAVGVKIFERSSVKLPDTKAAFNGVAVVDWEGSGSLDFFVAAHHQSGDSGASNMILHYDSEEKKLNNVADDITGISSQRSLGVAACDTDMDGKEEVFVANARTDGGKDALFKSGDEGAFDLLADAEQPSEKQGMSAACLDRHGKHVYGVAVVSTPTEDSSKGVTPILYEKSHGTWVDVSHAAGMNTAIKGEGICSGLVLGDMQDVFLTAGEGSSNAYMRNNLGNFADSTEQLDSGKGGSAPTDLANGGAVVHGAALCDINSDGRMDLVTGSYEGPLKIYAQDIRGGFSDVTDVAAPQLKGVNLAAMSMICADFDNDGFNDIFVNSYNEANRLLQGRADGTFALLGDEEIGDAVESHMHGTGAAVADIDGDGALDLLLAHGQEAEEELTLYRSHAEPENDWMRVMPLTKHGAPARGASVWFHVVHKSESDHTTPTPTGPSGGEDPTEAAKKAAEQREKDAIRGPPPQDEGSMSDLANQVGLNSLASGSVIGDQFKDPFREDNKLYDDRADSDIAEVSRPSTSSEQDGEYNKIKKETSEILDRGDAGDEADQATPSPQRPLGMGNFMYGDGDKGGDSEEDFADLPPRMMLLEVGEAATGKGKGANKKRSAAGHRHVHKDDALKPADKSNEAPTETPPAVNSRVIVRTIDAGSGYMSQNEPVAHMGLGKDWKVEKIEVQWPDGAKIAVPSPAARVTVRVPYPVDKLKAAAEHGHPTTTKKGAAHHSK